MKISLVLGCLQSQSLCSRSRSHSSSKHPHSSLQLSHRLSCASLLLSQRPHSTSCQDLLFCFRIILNISIIIFCFSISLLPGCPPNVLNCPCGLGNQHLGKWEQMTAADGIFKEMDDEMKI